MPSRPPESPVSSPGFPAFCDNEHAAHRRVLLGNHIRCLGSVLCLFIDSCLILRRGCNASGLLSLLVFLRCAPRWDIFFHNLFPVDSSVTTTCTAPTPSIWESASQRRCSISSCTESPASPAGRAAVSCGCSVSSLVFLFPSAATGQRRLPPAGSTASTAPFSVSGKTPLPFPS